MYLIRFKLTQKLINFASELNSMNFQVSSYRNIKQICHKMKILFYTLKEICFL